jgi:tRNA modification GTPase
VGGIPIQVLDTAGIRETEDFVEKIGVERSRNAASSSDLIIFTIDASQGWTADDDEIYQQVKHLPVILAINKIDLVEEEAKQNLKSDIQNPKSKIFTTASQNQGLEDLETAILEIIHAGKAQAADMDLAINHRQAAALVTAKTSLEQVQVTIVEQLPFDFWSIDLRSAIHALGEITGEEVTESVLGRIFSKFCIGK